MAVNLGTLLARIGLDVGPLARGANQARAIIHGIGGTSFGAAAGVRALAGSLVGLSGGFGVARALRSIVEEGARFEHRMTVLKAITEETGEGLEKFGNAAKEAALATEFSATEVAETMRILTLAGFSATEVLAAIPHVLDLATAGQIDLAKAADFSAQALRAFHLSAENMQRVGDIMVTAANKSNISMDNLAESFHYVSQIAYAMGLSVEETAALVAKLGDAGVRGSIAGTQLGRAIEIAATESHKFDVESRELLDVLDEMQREGATVADVLDLFKTRGGRAALLLRELTGETREFTEMLMNSGGEMARMAEVIRGSVLKEFESLRATVLLVVTEAFAEFAPTLARMIDAAQKWVKENRELLADLVKGFLAFAAATALAAANVFRLVVAAGPLVQVFVDALPHLMKIVEFFNHLVTAVEGVIRIITEIVATGMRSIAAYFTDGVAGIVNTWMRGGKQVVDVWNNTWGRIMGRVEVPDAITIPPPLPVRDKPDFGGGKPPPRRRGPSPEDLARRRINETVRIYESMLKETGITAAQMEAIWEKYEAARIKQIAQEANEMRKIGLEAAVIQDFTEFELRELERMNPRVPDFKRQNEIIEAEVDALKALVEDTKLTRRELDEIWDDYTRARLQQIEIEAQAMRENGVAAETIARSTGKAIQDLDSEYRELLRNNEFLDMIDLADSAAQGMADAFRNTFFDALRGEVVRFKDFWEIFMNSILTRVAQAAADEITAIFAAMFAQIRAAQSSSDGGGIMGFFANLFGGFFAPQSGGATWNEEAAANFTPGSGVPRAAEGALVTGPSLLFAGERGPEAVIPLAHLFDQRFMKRFAGAGMGEGVTVNNYIESPDVSGFKASQSQIMSQMGSVLSRAARRNG